MLHLYRVLCVRVLLFVLFILRSVILPRSNTSIKWLVAAMMFLHYFKTISRDETKSELILTYQKHVYLSKSDLQNLFRRIKSISLLLIIYFIFDISSLWLIFFLCGRIVFFPSPKQMHIHWYFPSIYLFIYNKNTFNNRRNTILGVFNHKQSK